MLNPFSKEKADFIKLYKSEKDFKSFVDKAINELDLSYEGLLNLEESLYDVKHIFMLKLQDIDKEELQDFLLRYLDVFVRNKNVVEKTDKLLCKYSWRIEPYFSVCGYSRKEYFTNKTALENLIKLLKTQLDYLITMCFKLMKENKLDFEL